MLRPSEAARVMEISLGKLANIRNQRVSSSLHKNLLVARVFNQVRTIVTVDETHEDVDGVDDKCALNSECADPSFGIPCPVPLNERYPNYEPDADAEQQPYSSEAHASVDARVSDFKTVALGALCSDEESNMVFVDDDRNDRDYSADANRGFKRRSECDEVDCVSRKRLRHQRISTSVDWRSSELVSDFEDECSTDMDAYDASLAYDNMMMVETEQISSLVTVFSSSFKGLGHLEGSVDDQVLGPRSSNSDSNEQQHFTTLSPGSSLRRGMSLPDLCAKQAELLCQKFQQNPPVVALTV